MEKLRLCTFAVPLSGNKGSASMALGLMDNFRKEGVSAEFLVFSYYPQRDRLIAEGLEGVEVFPGHPKDLFLKILPAVLVHKVGIPLPRGAISRAVLGLADADGVLLMGGTTFTDSMLYKVPWNVLAAIPALFLRKPVVFLSQTLGPFARALNRLSARWTLRKAREVHGRGRKSVEEVNSLGLSNVRYEPDLSFPMMVPAFAPHEMGRDRFELLGRLLEDARGIPIGVAPNSILLKKCKAIGLDYTGLIEKIIRILWELQCQPILIAHSFRPGTSQQHNNDHHICRELMERLQGEVGLRYAEADLNPRELRSFIGQMELLIACRFHSMVSALSQGIPPLTFGWGGQKYIEVLDEFGLESLYHSFHELKNLDLRRVIEQSLEQRHQTKESISCHLPQVIAHAGKLPHRLQGLLKGDPGSCGAVETRYS
mgnify:FL=1